MSEITTNGGTQTAQPAAALLFIHAQTPLHPGSGTALGAVDMPVQRERHTQWPVIPGSTLKGILRDAVRDKVKDNYAAEDEDIEKGRPKRSQRQVANEDDPDLVTVFGPGKVEPNTSHAGAISLTDARILAFPVRSLNGIFAWVTCPSVLSRLNRDVKLAHTNGVEIQPLKENEALCLEKGPLLVDSNNLVLEEFDFDRIGDADNVANWIAKRAFNATDTFTPARLKSHLAVIPDDHFTHLVRHATEVVARIGLDYEHKTVKNGALFYEEFLPTETLFYSVVLAAPSRRKRHEKTASEILAYLDEKMPLVLQIGADETIGKGICAVRLNTGATPENNTKEGA